ncbi:hypothetical protein Hanom_Chr01g00052371 [Helianthus anomalus]
MYCCVQVYVVWYTSVHTVVHLCTYCYTLVCLLVHEGKRCCTSVYKMMFETEVGIGLLHLYTKDLQPSVLIGPAIINCFASMLNYKEVKRT